MQDVSATDVAVSNAGVAIMNALYSGKPSETLGRLRYNTYCRLVTNSLRRFHAERLPPSENATKLHSLRVHLQAVMWVSLGKAKLNPENWGWRLEKSRLAPVPMTDKPGPKHLM
jgi:hypothetical protein